MTSNFLIMFDSSLLFISNKLEQFWIFNGFITQFLNGLSVKADTLL